MMYMALALIVVVGLAIFFGCFHYIRKDYQNMIDQLYKFIDDKDDEKDDR